MENDEATGDKPAWKQNWDNARQLARGNDLQQARMAYRDLLDEKPNIVEARWEYGKLLVRLRQWAESAKIVEGLLELEPSNQEYLLAAGEIALKNKLFSKAVKYFGQIYESDPTGPHSQQILVGMIDGFKGLGNTVSAFLLLEQLYLRDSDDEDVLVDLARLATKVGRVGRARHYYSVLTELFPGKPTYLLEAGKAHDEPGFRDHAADYWHRYLELDPDYLPLHKKLAEYYLAEDRAQAALPHLIEMYNQGYLVTPLALRIAEIYNQRMGRADKALRYYEQFLNAYPQNTNVTHKISGVRRVLATQYLPIVENDGGEQLWKDLELITQKPDVIFLLMADQLGNEEKIGQEIAVLEIVHQHRKDDKDLSYRLAQLYLQTGRLRDAQKMIILVDEGSFENKQYLLTKASIERQLLLDVTALQTLVSYLGFEGNDMQAAREAIELAGGLGLIHELEMIWQRIDDSARYSVDQLQLNLAYALALRNNGMFTDTDKTYEILLQKVTETEDIVDIYFHMADTQLARGHVFIAEQIVRQVLARNLAPERALAKLTRLSVLDGRTTLARSWLTELVKRQEGAELDEIDDLPAVSHFLLVELQIAEEEYEEAIELLTAHSLYSSGVSSDLDFARKTRQYLARIYYMQGEYKDCLAVLNAEDWQGAKDQEYYVLRSWATKEQGGDAVSTERAAMEEVDVSVTTLIARAQSYRLYNNARSALQAVDKALEILPQSVRAALEKIHVLNDLSRFYEALAIVDSLHSDVLEGEYFDRLKLQLEFKSGNFEKIVEKVEQVAPPMQQVDELAVKAEPALKAERENLYFWKKLLLARALWAQNKRAEALKVYDSLLTVPVDTMFLEKMEVEKVNFHLPPLKKPFWNLLTYVGEEEQDR
ncbi:MAG TPA: tetratricopeptide repeat protein, partial [Desulfopila sp.]|nr:tetratricopeptide repeat protein [Desulfopila sp.]